MLNKSGITTTTATAPKQILANVDLQSSVGCIVPQSLVPSADVNGKKIAKAGTPIKIDLMNVNTAVVAVTAGHPMNAVLLHDVDVTAGAANGAALVFGFVNVNRVEASVASAIVAALAIEGASQLITFCKL